MVYMIAELGVIVVTVVRNLIECILEASYLDHNILPEPLGRIEVLPDIKDLFPVLIKECLCICKHLINLMVHLCDLSDILIIIILDNCDNLLLLFV